jgi:hypothetical protein
MTRVILIALCLAACGGKRDDTKDTGSAKAPPASDGLTALRATAAHVIDELEKLETTKDVTCWTSFRQLDWFIAEKSYSEFGTLAKIAAMKALVRATWQKATAAAKGPQVTAADVDGAVTLPKIELTGKVGSELASFANDIGIKNFTDYQKTAEHTRIALAVIKDEMYRTGGSPRLKPLDASGIRALSSAATTLSLMVLKESSKAADAAGSQVIEGPHVQEAHKKLAGELGLSNEPYPRQPLAPEQVAAHLQPLTKRLIDAKVTALQKFNKGTSTVADLNKVTRIPVTEDGLKAMLLNAQSFVHFIAGGYEPMQADNYLSDGSFAKTQMPRLAYVDEIHAQNAVMQLFRHHMMPNGDIVVRFEPNPGPVTPAKLEPFEVKLLDHEQNGVRDSAVHWIAMQNVWKEKPYAMDPFAAEYVSEVVSMMFTLWIRRGEVLAAQMGKAQLDAEVMQRVRKEAKAYAQVEPPEAAPAVWTDERKQQKQALVASLSLPLFKDVSRTAGLPTKFATWNADLANVLGHVEPDRDLKKVDAHVAPDTKNLDGHVEPQKDLKKVDGHVEPQKDLKKVDGHVEPQKDLKKVDGHVEPQKDLKNVDAHVAPDTKNLPGHVAPDVTSVQGHFNLQTIMGGGIAVGDVDGDGYPDLYLTGEELGRLYLNQGKRAPGKFVDATERYGLPTDLKDGHGTLFFDLEGDGDLDLLVLRSDHPSALFRNDGGKFTDVAKELGFVTIRGAHVAHVFDFDQDGDLDIYVGYYGAHAANASGGAQRSVPALDGRNGSPNQLWRNDGDKFVEIGKQAKVDDVGWTLAVGSFDHDGDGDLDLFLANDFGADVFYENNGDGTFKDITDATRTGDRGSGMNVEFGDVNRDGRWDIYVTNIDMFSKNIKVIFPRDETTISIDEQLTRAFQYLSGNKLHVWTPQGYRAEENLRFEPKDRGWGWDAAFFDYDNDGDDDLYITNGWINGSYAGNQKNQMYLNHEGFLFLAPESSDEAFPGNTRSVAAIDLDLDGDIDLVVNNFRQPPRVLLNTQRSGNRYIQLSLVGKGKNPRAFGATATIMVEGKPVLRQLSGGRGYLSQGDIAITAGVGKAAAVDVELRWPDGTKTRHANLGTNKRHILRQP